MFYYYSNTNGADKKLKKDLEEKLCKYGNKCLYLKQVTQIREISAI